MMLSWLFRSKSHLLYSLPNHLSSWVPMSASESTKKYISLMSVEKQEALRRAWNKLQNMPANPSSDLRQDAVYEWKLFRAMHPILCSIHRPGICYFLAICFNIQWDEDVSQPDPARSLYICWLSPFLRCCASADWLLDFDRVTVSTLLPWVTK